MPPTTHRHINPRANQSMVGTQRVALRITSANTGTDAPVETLRATSPTHHAPTRNIRDVARYVSTTGNGHANHGQHMAIPTQRVASLHGIHQTALGIAGQRPQRHGIAYRQIYTTVHLRKGTTV